MQISRLRWNDVARFDVVGLIGICVFSLFGGLAAFEEYFATDAIGYRFLVSDKLNECSMVPVRSLADVWVSQVHHWHSVNGRFVCHFIVQIFCGLLPQWVWAVANGAVYGFLAWLCARWTKIFGQGVWIGMATLLISVPRLAFSPPMQVNYMWGYVVELSFIYLFLARGNAKSGYGSVVRVVVWTVLAFCAGQWNEAFSVPIGVGLVVLFLDRKGRFTGNQWVGFIAFSAGALLLCLAPGNMVRLSGEINEGFKPVDYIRHFTFAFYPLVAGGLIACLLFGRKRVSEMFRDVKKHAVILMLCGIVCGSYVFGLLTGFSSGNRVVAAVPLVVILFLNLLGRTGRPHFGGLIILLVGGGVCAVARLEKARETNTRYEMYDVLYRESSDGRVYVPVSILETDWREDRFASFFITYQRKSEVPGAPAIKLLPEEARGLAEGPAKDSDFNAVIPLSERSWLFVRSEKSPARFLLKRRIGIPNTPLTLPISDRELDFVSPSNDIAIDTLKHVRLGLYVNERPYVEATPYMIEE